MSRLEIGEGLIPEGHTGNGTLMTFILQTNVVGVQIPKSSDAV